MEGAPGLRLGVLASGDEHLVASVSKGLPIWNINSFAEFYLQICEKYKADFAEAMERFYPVRDELHSELQKIPYMKPIPSRANYITCKLNGNLSARELTVFLLNRYNILVRDVSGKNGVAGEYIRVAVKTPEENARLISALLTLRSAQRQ